MKKLKLRIWVMTISTAISVLILALIASGILQILLQTATPGK